MKALIFAVAAVALFLWVGGYHIVWKPTPDQLYGCTVEQRNEDGECK